MLRPVLACLALLLACDSKTATPPASAPPTPPTPAPGNPPGNPPIAPGPVIPGHLVSKNTVDRIFARGLREQWFGMYMTDKKVGFARVTMRPSAAGEPDGLIASIEATLRVGAPGAAGEVQIFDERFYAADPPYALVEVRARQTSSAGQVEQRYRREDDGLVVVQTVDGRAQPERRIAATAETALTILDQLAVEPAEVRAGMSATVSEFETDGEVDKQTSVKVVDVRRQPVSGVATQVVVLSTVTEGEQTVTESVLASGGVALSASLGGNLTIRLEEKDQAQSAVAGFDMIGDAVKVERPLGNPVEVKELHLRLRFASDFRLRDAPNQEIDRRPDGALDVALFSRPGLPVMPAERTAALAATRSIDSGEPAIVELAQKVAGAGEPAERVGRLIDWTYQNLDKNLATNLGTASQVLARRAGDCTEHSILFVALARAAGIPARELSGLMYMGDGVQRFGWHAWAEVEIGGRWVEVDPAWGEHVADATHLALGVGEDSDWVTTIGTLRIDVVAPASAGAAR